MSVSLPSKSKVISVRISIWTVRIWMNRMLLEESVLNPGLVIQPTSVTTNARHCFPGLCSVSHSVMSREVFMGWWMLPKCLEPPLNVFSSGFTGHSSCSPSLTTLDRLWVDMVSETAGALPGLSSSRARAASFSRRPGVGGDQVQGSPRGKRGWGWVGKHLSLPFSALWPYVVNTCAHRCVEHFN